MLCANGHNIVGQWLPTLLDVTCFVCLHTLLHVVGSVLLGAVALSLKPVKLLATCKYGRNNSQQCCELLGNNVVSVCTGLNTWTQKPNHFILMQLIYTCFLYVPSRIASKCSLEYTEPQGLEGLFTTIALVRSSIRDSRWSRSTSQDLSG